MRDYENKINQVISRNFENYHGPCQCKLCCMSGHHLCCYYCAEKQFLLHSWVHFSWVAQLCPTLWDPMNCSTPGLPVCHQLPEFTQTHVHRVGDTIQPSYPLSSPSPPASNPSQHQSLCNESTLRMRWPKFWKVKDVYKKQTFTEGIQAKKKQRNLEKNIKKTKDGGIPRWSSG